MRASVVAVSSVNASFNAISRNTYVDRREPELHPSSTTTTLNTRPTKGPPRTGKPQSYEELARPTHPKIIGQECLAEQVPLPRSFTNIANDAADVAPQEGVFARCFILLKRAGAKLMMPPYTVDGELNHAAIKQDSINLDATLTKLPLM